MELFNWEFQRLHQTLGFLREPALQFRQLGLVLAKRVWRGDLLASRKDGEVSQPKINADLDEVVLKRRIAYLDKEHALIAAKHIFGLKGGEL